MNRGRDEGRLDEGATLGADPVLRAAELPGLFFYSASSGQKYSVDLSDEPVGEGESFLNPG